MVSSNTYTLDLLEAIHTQRAIRHFKAGPVPEEMIGHNWPQRPFGRSSRPGM